MGGCDVLLVLHEGVMKNFY